MAGDGRHSGGLDLPHLDAERWVLVCDCLKLILDQAENVQEVCCYMRQYLPKRFAGIQLKGLTAALQGVGGGEPCYESFFKSTLRVIIDAARDLPQRMQTHGLDSIPILPQLVAGQEATECRLPRAVCQSLLANMFLCTFPQEGGKGGARCVADREDMPTRTFLGLLECGGQPQEVAKLRMFIHYFERVPLAPHSGQAPSGLGQGQDDFLLTASHVPSSPAGFLHLFRRRADLDESCWDGSASPLLKLEVVPPMIGFENADWGHDCLHADFANMYLGGGVLSGGCVQEEIRFAICPELLIGVLLCPVMSEAEAIQIVGAEQFSAYEGYMFSLRYGGDYQDPSKRGPQGTVLNGITAIDALDGRYIRPFDLRVQLRPKHMLRELNKAAAGFRPPSAGALGLQSADAPFPILATGNWGCGVFGGHVELKAVLQWMAASEGKINVRYFPFNEPVGPRLQDFCDKCVEAGITVGALWGALRHISYDPEAQAQAAGGFLEELLVHAMRAAPLASSVDGH